MTPQEQEIIDAIWGEDADDIDRAEATLVVEGIFAMADLMKARMLAGKIAVVPLTDYFIKDPKCLNTFYAMLGRLHLVPPLEVLWFGICST